MGHPSASDDQQRAEGIILSALAARLGVALAPRSLFLEGGSRVDVDGVAADDSVFVEVYAHQGRLRGGQFHKVARDALKLITLNRCGHDARLILVLGDDEAVACVTAKSWLSEALRVWGIEVLPAEMDDPMREALRGAQARQVMVNPSDSAPHDDAVGHEVVS